MNITKSQLRLALTLPLFYLTITALVPRTARAQEGEEKAKDIPIKKQPPLIDRRALQIPGRLPNLEPTRPVKPQHPAVTGEAGELAAPPAPPPPVAPLAKPGDEKGPNGEARLEADRRCRPLLPREKIDFEFKEADIRDIVTAISKTMCKNFILTSKVRSQKFDIISPQKITVGEAWQAFLSALEANDFTLFRVGRYYKIIQASDGTRAPVEILEENDKLDVDDRMVTKIWHLEHGGDVNGVVNYLNIFKSNKGQIHPFASTNTIIATDFATSIQRLERILDEIDNAGVSERIHVVTVDYATATEIAEKLSAVFEPQKAAGAGGAKPAVRAAAPKPGAPAQVLGRRSGAPVAAQGDTFSLSKILPDDRTNKLIIIASEESFRQIMALKKKLDIPSGGGEGVHVLRLRHANAEELSSTLASLASGKPTSARAPRLGAAAPKPGAPAAPAAAGAAAGQAALFQGDVKVTADKATNSLVITASKSDFNSMKRVIEQLDVPRLQVFVEAVIMEVSLKRDINTGLSWHGGINSMVDGKASPVVFGFQPTSEFSSLAVSTNPLALVGITGLAGAWRGPTLEGSEALGIPGGIPAIGVVIQALQSDNDVNVISTPHLLTMDNEEAEIQVSQKVPFSSGLSLGGLSGLAGLAGQAGAGAQIPNLSGLGLNSLNITREDVGLTLKLKPQINDQQYVRLEIDQELSDVVGTDAVTNQPITSKRSAKTVVVVRDQDSVVIGGLVRERESIGESKIPILGDVPGLGWLFRRQLRGSEKVNLILVLTPYIIRGPADFYTIYQRKMEERKEFVTRYYGDTAEYRASIDWDRKPGPVAQYRQELREELMKAENGGPGAEGEEVIETPDDEVVPEGIELPKGSSEGGTPPGEMPPDMPPGEITPEIAPPPPPVPPDQNP